MSEKVKDTIKAVLDELKNEVKLSKEEGLSFSIIVKLDGEVKEVDIIHIDDSEVTYLNSDCTMEKMKLKDFRLDLIRYNRDLVDYIKKRI